jgi:putative Mg2+ transporter-C (MgtC) family protein
MVSQIVAVIAMLIATVLGMVIGAEREMRLKPAGVRTHILVCVGAAMFTLISGIIYPTNPAYIPAYIVTGIGFLGAGMIIKDNKGISGLTTSASVWTTAAVGMAVGAQLYYIAAAGTVITVLVPLIPHPHKVIEKLRE